MLSPMQKSYNAPGKAHREGMSLIELMEMFQTEAAVDEVV